MEVKERILLKAHEQFNKFGIRSVSMDDIASGLGMSKKTLYQYFSDKDELVGTCFYEVMENSRIRCLGYKEKAENPVHEVFMAFEMIQEMFAEMNPALLYDMEKYHPACFKKFWDFKYGFLYNAIKENLQQGVDLGLYRPEIDPDVLARTRIETVMMAFNTEIFPNNRTALLHIERQLLDLFLYGIVTTKGQKLIQKYKTQASKKLKS